MRISITLIFILSVLQLSGQDFQWAQQEGGDLRDIGFSIAVDGLGNSYVTGYFEGTAAIGDSTFMSFAERDIFVAKYDANGNFLWAQQDGGDGSDEGRGITVDGLGNCYVTGYFQGTATIGDSIFTSAGGNGDIFITKYDANGTFIWAIRDGGSSFDVGEGIAVDGSGNSFVTGFFTGTAEFGDTTIMAVGSSTDIFIMKYDQNGVFQWAHQDGGIFLTKGFGISVDGSSNSYITGFFRGIVTIGDSTFMSVGGIPICLSRSTMQMGIFSGHSKLMATLDLKELESV